LNNDQQGQPNKQKQQKWNLDAYEEVDLKAKSLITKVSADLNNNKSEKYIFALRGLPVMRNYLKKDQNQVFDDL